MLIGFLVLCTLFNAWCLYKHLQPVKAVFVDERPAVITLANASDYGNFEPGMLVYTSSGDGSAKPAQPLVYPSHVGTPVKQPWWRRKWSSWVAQATLLCVLIANACGCASVPANGIPENGSDAWQSMKAAQWAYHSSQVSQRTACKSPKPTVALRLSDAGEWVPISRDKE